MSETPNPGSVNKYLSNGTANEQNLVESLIIESLNMFAVPMIYMPRKLVALDRLLGEDARSEFDSAFTVPIYMKNSMGFDGVGAALSMSGFSLEQTATFTVARKTWQQLVGNDPNAVLPQRPTEGDLIYFPQSNGIFEVKYVVHNNPFYQLGKLYVYDLTVNLFSYSSEKIATGVDSIDKFNSKSLDQLINPIVDDADQANADNSTIATDELPNAQYDPNNPFNE